MMTKICTCTHRIAAHRLLKLKPKIRLPLGQPGDGSFRSAERAECTKSDCPCEKFDQVPQELIDADRAAKAEALWSRRRAKELALLPSRAERAEAERLDLERQMRRQRQVYQ